MARGVPLSEPVAVMRGNTVVACSAEARRYGVSVGNLKREAQSRCVTLQILSSDTRHDAQVFERVVEVLEQITPRVEVFEPGILGFPVRGPSSFFGGETALVHQVQKVVKGALEQVRDGYGEYGRVGIADGIFAAKVAAAHSSPLADGSVVVEAGASAAFLAQQPITLLDDGPLVDVLSRLGFTDLGGWASLPIADVIGRFGRDGVVAHRLANGLDEAPLVLRTPAPDFTVSTRFEPPSISVAHCVYAGEQLAQRLVENLRGEGRTCLRLGVEVETENGALFSRWWRYEGVSVAASVIAERVRWQLEGWLQQDESSRPRSGVLKLSLVPEEVIDDSGNQLALWDVDPEQIEKITRVARQIEKMGTDQVCLAEQVGGIGPSERIALQPIREASAGNGGLAAHQQPWPGRIPAPSPARVFDDLVAVEVIDIVGNPVGVSGRGEISNPPKVLRSGAYTTKIVQWAGPWLDDRNWWDKKAHHRRARAQVITSAGRAYLLVLERQRWWMEAVYD